nr:MAG: hypothetical protein [Bacteriophage sp.]
MKKLKVAMIVLLLGFTIYLCFRNYKLNQQLSMLPDKEIIQHTDTIYLRKDFLPISYENLLNPSRILLYNSPHSSVSQGLCSTDSAEISEKDSLVQLVIDKNQLTLNFLNQNSGIYSSRLFNIDPNNYKYSWYNGKLTTQEIKSRIRLVPYVYGKYRPFNNLWDLGTGISIETKRFNYKLGINSFYYPRYFSGIKTDLELVVTYKF